MASDTAVRHTSRTLNGRDLINVGIFTAVYFVVMFGCGTLGFLSPLFSGVGFILGILANGVVIALYLSRVPKVGALTILGLIVGTLMVVTGHPWLGMIITPVLGLIGDLVARSGGHRDPRLNTLAYAVLSLWYLGPLLPLVYDSVGYRKYLVEAMNESYAEAWTTVFGPAALPFWALGFFVSGLAGGWFGHNVLKRQFRRAGVA
ncbi:energy-coupling factor transport system substrate-specific component [Austwickia chelonae]|uniref:Uncharacterized protein n=1 Tax=Austwickia chelonae NBRC 105200 TaxID=1184607 RepID=K6V9Q8_9MICO|nr:MptD family putative ECF transporter S component [Austwickia chelonae]GAB78968.1 hypothetical protein AUCHE_17_01840 [Austwickia chelonae NBRC 105200]SEV87503.1 energy-coupling factor transport system substrate-specific component [Austwickia chelonae]